MLDATGYCITLTDTNIFKYDILEEDICKENIYVGPKFHKLDHDLLFPPAC